MIEAGQFISRTLGRPTHSKVAQATKSSLWKAGLSVVVGVYMYSMGLQDNMCPVPVWCYMNNIPSDCYSEH